MTPEQIAQVCHEANCAYCQVVGDDTLPHWHDLEEQYRQSSIRGVQEALKGATPHELHAKWRDERMANGWVYGQTLDRAAKIHPALVPYNDLPAEQKTKDRLFISVVEALR